MQALDKDGGIGAPQGAVADIVRQRGIDSVVITNTHFNCFAGSQLVTLDLATLLRRSGVGTVVILTEHISPALDDAAQAEGIRVVSLLKRGWTEQIPERIDLIWGHHWPILGMLLMSVTRPLRHLILSSLSAYEPFELNAFFSAAADLRVYNSQETQRQIGAAGAVAVPGGLLLNSLPDSWFADAAPPAALRRIALLSNHAPDELLRAQEQLGWRGLEVENIGMTGTPRLMDAAAIDEFDAIVTIGHSVQKAMARQRPVFVYDRFGGPGWMTRARLDESEFFNHSGRDVGRRQPAEQIAADIINGFPAALAETAMLHDEARRRYRLDANLAALLRMLPERDWRRIDISAPAFALERSAVQAFWQGRIPETPLALSPLGQARSLPQVRAVLRVMAGTGDGIGRVDLHQDERPLDRAEVTVPAEVGAISLTGRIELVTAPAPDTLYLRRDDGIVFPCQIDGEEEEETTDDGRAVRFRATLALATDTRRFTLVARRAGVGVDAAFIAVMVQNDSAPNRKSGESARAVASALPGEADHRQSGA